MSDGRVEIEVEVNGKGVTVLNKNLDQLEGKSNKAGASIKNLAVSMGLVKVASAAFDVLKNSLDLAIDRFDTMQKYPKVMETLGFSTEQSERSIRKLADGIEGLPTTLQDVVSKTQRIASITGDLNKSTDTVLALNNAFLASGASADDASRGTEQYIQMLSTGQVDLESWKTLQESMPIGLQKTAEAMGFVGKTAQRDLYNALKEGEITFDQFTDELIKLGTGTGELAKLAKENSKGIKTSFTNLVNAVSKGVANLIEKFNNLSKAMTGKSIAENIDSLKVVVNNAFNGMGKAIDALTPILVEFSQFFRELLSTIIPLVTEGGALVPVIYGLAASFAALKIINTVNSLIAKTDALMVAAGLSGKALVITTKAQLAAQTANTAATKADILMRAAQNGQITLGTTLIALFTGGISASTVVTTLMTAAVGALRVAINLLLGPVGLVILALGALVAAGKKLWDHFNQESKETKKLKKDVEELTESTKKQIDVTKENAEKRKSSAESLEAERSSTQALIEEIEMITSKEKASNKEKERAKEIAEALSASMGNLALVYDDQNNTLSETSTKLTEATEGYHALKTAAQAQQDINDMLKERNDNEAKLLEININREKWNQTLRDTSGSTGEAKEKIAELAEQEKKLQTTNQELADEIIRTANAHEESMQIASQAVEAGVFKQSVSYEALQGKAKETMDSLRETYQSLADSVGNAFDQIEQKEAISTAQMIENLTKNQQAVQQWSTNIAELARRGVDEGLLEQLRRMGPEGAAQAQVLVNSSDEELRRLNEVYRNTSTTSLQAMKEGYQLEKNGLNEEVANIIVSQKETLTQQVQSSNFSEIGSSVTEDVKSGIENGREAVRTATQGLAATVQTELSNGATNIRAQEKGKEVPDGMRSGIDSGRETAVSSVSRLMDNIQSNLATKNDKKKYSDIGQSIPDGMKQGIETNKNNPVKSTEKMAQEISEKAKQKLDSHSPSRVFKTIGSDVAAGLGLGIQQNSNKAISAVQRVAQLLPNPMKNVPNVMRSIGSMISAGLAQGIRSAIGSVTAAANALVAQAERAARAKAKIHSPSRLFRDNVGRYIPEGIAVGITRSSQSVDKAMARIYDGLMKPIQPETALATGRIGLAHSGNQIINNTYHQNEGIDLKALARVLNDRPLNVQAVVDPNQVNRRLTPYNAATVAERTIFAERGMVNDARWQ